MRPPGFPGNPPARMPRAPTPARSPPPRPLRGGDVAFRPTHDVGPRDQCISGLKHAAYALPVNASRPRSPQAHASLGSGWWPTLAGWGWIPTGVRTRFRRSHHGILSPLTGLSRHTRWCTTYRPLTAAAGSLSVVIAAGARSRHEIEGPSEVQEQVSLASARAGVGRTRRRDAVALCRRRGRLATIAVRSTRRADEVLKLCDRNGPDAAPRLPVALAPSRRLLAVGLVVDGCRSRSPQPHHALPTESVSRG